MLADLGGPVDVCVVGGGPAGLTVARSLGGQGLKVLILEAGGLTLDPPVQDLGVGTVQGDPAYVRQPLSTTRRRMLGGTASAWDVQTPLTSNALKLVPLSESDFAQWPFSRSALDPAYRRAHQMMTPAPFDYGAEAWNTPDASALALDRERIVSSVYHCAPGAAITGSLVDAVRRDHDTHIVTDAVVTKINVTDGVATGVDVIVAGKAAQVRARSIVIATGAIESARLLLASNDVHPAGLGNAYDLVGRGLMDHPLVQTGVLRPTMGLRRFGFYDLRTIGRAVVIGKLEVAPQRLNGKGLPHAAFQLMPRPPGFDPVALRRLSLMLRERQVDKLVATALGLGSMVMNGSLLRNVIARVRGDWPDLSRGTGWSRRADLERRFDCFAVFQKCCQRSTDRNRVQLGTHTDALGQRVADVTWTWTEEDVVEAGRAQTLLASTLADAGIGVLTISDLGDGRPMLLGGTHHFMGTTRMHHNPEKGVCSPRGRVHQVANLHVVSTALFPSGGYANPTLTLLALAIQIGEGLARELTHRPEVNEEVERPAPAVPQRGTAASPPRSAC